MKTILFQGDSITDSGRDKERNQHNGFGYATMVSGVLGYRYPGQYVFVNRGVNGNRICNLRERMQKDILDVKPDYLSLLIGVNDAWFHALDEPTGVDASAFQEEYRQLLRTVITALPDIKILLFQPFLVRNVANPDISEKKCPALREEVAKRAEKVKELAEEFALPCVDLQCLFDEVTSDGEGDAWAPDGVHPTAAGHYILTKEWIRWFEEIS